MKLFSAHTLFRSYEENGRLRKFCFGTLNHKEKIYYIEGKLSTAIYWLPSETMTYDNESVTGRYI